MIAVKLFALFSVVSAALAGPVCAADWNPLPDTGQTKCYDLSGDEIACPAEGQPLHGQDAQYHSPDPSYTDNGDGTITDNNTGLVWMKNTADTNTDGQITDDDYPTGDCMTWQDAIDYCTGLGNGWRLPELIELRSIVDYGRYNPAINTTYFTCRSWLYWTANTVAGRTSIARHINFDNGQGGWQCGNPRNYVRCVRARQ